MIWQVGLKWLKISLTCSQPKTKQVCNELEAAGRPAPVSTVKCVLHQHGLRGCCARKKPLIQTWQLKARLMFAADMYKDKNFWRKTGCPNETKTELFCHNEWLTLTLNLTHWFYQQGWLKFSQKPAKRHADAFQKHIIEVKMAKRHLTIY